MSKNCEKKYFYVELLIALKYWIRPGQNGNLVAICVFKMVFFSIKYRCQPLIFMNPGERNPNLFDRFKKKKNNFFCHFDLSDKHISSKYKRKQNEHASENDLFFSMTKLYETKIKHSTFSFSGKLLWKIKKKKQKDSVNIPWAGEKTFKYKQSSDWFCRNGNKRFKYSSRPFGIFSNAPVSFCMFGKRCGHTGLNLSDIRTPFHGDGARVGLNLYKRKWKEEKKENCKYRIKSQFFTLITKMQNKMNEKNVWKKTRSIVVCNGNLIQDKETEK